jgi:FkbM family methyltransferase
MRVLSAAQRLARRHVWTARLLQLLLLRAPGFARGNAVAVFSSGLSMQLDLRDRTQAVMFCGTYELAESRMLQDLLGPGDVFVDVGAHVGWFTLRAARLVGESGTVHAFEPYPPNAEILRRNISRNHLRNVEIYDVAISDARGTARIARLAGSDSGSPTLGTRGSADEFDVPTARLDDALPHETYPALVKIDVEGHERDVLKGARETLRRARALLIEVNTSPLGSNGHAVERVTADLRALGFTRFDQLPSGRAFGRSCGDHVNVLAKQAP